MIHPEMEYYADIEDLIERIGEIVRGILSKEADHRYMLKKPRGSCHAYLSSSVQPTLLGSW